MKKRLLSVLVLMSVCLGLFSSCGGETAQVGAVAPAENTSQGGYLRFVDEVGDNYDPQRTTGLYCVALNIFDRLVEIRAGEDNSSAIVPSLADSWEVSEDGLRYTFHLHPGVRFSNGAALTSSDVLYTLTRLLTAENAVNQDVAMPILGAADLAEGKADELRGFEILSELDFIITLEQPYAAFLANLSTPGGSIFDEESTQAAGDDFGVVPEKTVGTGPFRWTEWQRGSSLTLEANPDCWSGAPRCRGLKLILVGDSEEERLMFERGELDILDLDAMGADAEYFIRAQDYQGLLHAGPRVGITYVALNQSVEPLNNVRVRRALQLALNREVLLLANASGRGAVENGIFPRGLIGYDPELPEIPWDAEQARKLLREAGYPDGFPLELWVEDNAGASRTELVELIARMWQDVGIEASVRVVSADAFMAERRAGRVPCYVSTWSADFNDPDNFIYTFFGTKANTLSRSLCYPDQAVMDRVVRARAITDEDERIAEYRALEEQIVQRDAAWIPLFSKQHYFVVSDRVDGFKVSWNGWSSNQYRDVSVIER